MKFIGRHLWLFIFGVTVIAGVWEIHSMTQQSSDSPQTSQSEEGPPASVGLSQRLMLTVHLDLKGAPPSLVYLKKLLTMMAAAGCDSLLIEYEDMFPYRGKLANLAAGNHYRPSQIRELVGWAHDLGMQIIPLIQTFGHMESALKLEEWAYLRELPPYPSEICPSHPDSFALITEMITQVMTLHRNSHYIHIGCDEVYHLDMCQKCRTRSLSPRAIFEDHVIRLAKWIKERHPHVRPIIWDDMMRKWSPEEVVNSRLGSYVIPMVWVYTGEVLRAVQAKWWLYAKAFKTIWVAGAFKGAEQPRSDFPHIGERLENQKSWLHVVHNTKATHNVEGLVLTGWSRFDHFAVLCELLPVAIPSLMLNLLYVKQYLSDDGKTGRQSLYKNWQKSLECPVEITPEKINSSDWKNALLQCNWPGADLYRLMVLFRDLESKVKKIEHLVGEKHGWLTRYGQSSNLDRFLMKYNTFYYFSRYNVAHNFTNPARIVDELIELDVRSNLRRLQDLKLDIYRQLVRYTDEYTAEEWIEDRLLPLTDSLSSLNNIVDSLSSKKIWPKRPLKNNIPLFG